MKKVIFFIVAMLGISTHIDAQSDFVDINLKWLNKIDNELNELKVDRKHKQDHKYVIHKDCEICVEMENEHSRHHGLNVNCPLCNSENDRMEYERVVGAYHTKQYGHFKVGFVNDSKCVKCKYEKLELGEKLYSKLLKKREKNWKNSREYKERLAKKKEFKNYENEIKAQEEANRERKFREFLGE